MCKAPNFDATEWLNNYGDSLYRYALLRTRSEVQAEELVQDTLLAGLESIASFKEQASIKTWLLGIMKHKIIDYFRATNSNLESLEDYNDDTLMTELFTKNGHWQNNVAHWKTPEKIVNDEQFWQVYQQCLSRLPQAMADLFLLRTVDELPVELCCQILNIATTNQLYTALSRTRLKLRQCLDTYWFTKE